MWLAIVWLVLTVVFVIVELIADRYVLPLAIGAGLAGISTFFYLPWYAQVIVFAVVTLLGYVLFKPNKAEKSSRRRKRDYDDFGEF